MELHISRITKEQYPFLLQNIDRPPAFLDVAGTIPSDNHKFLCVIGSRTHSTYGMEVCRNLILGLRGYPIVIISGLAIGIDSIAHESALDAGLGTIAFPGSGLSEKTLYPRSRRLLASRIIENGGALLSPFAPEQEGAYWTFPSRNRLMAATAHAVLIIEGRQGSGTLGTANFATEFNRDILAVPGSIDSELSYGPHMLIRRGAALISSSEHILDELGFSEKQHTATMISTELLQTLSSPQRDIVSLLRLEPHTASDILEKVSLSLSQFNMLMSQLELLGIVAEENGAYRISRS